MSFSIRLELSIFVTYGGNAGFLIISTVYWAKMVAFYIENNKSLMNVSVARVKDFCFVFGSRICCFIPNQA